MRIQTSRRLHFRHGVQSFITQGMGVVQTAPDWIVATDYFHIAKNAGLLKVLEEKPVFAGVDLPPSQPEAPPKEEAEGAQEAPAEGIDIPLKGHAQIKVNSAQRGKPPADESTTDAPAEEPPKRSPRRRKTSD